MTNQYSTTYSSHNEMEMKDFGILQKLYKVESFWNFLTNIVVVEFEISAPLIPKPGFAHDPEPLPLPIFVTYL